MQVNQTGVNWPAIEKTLEQKTGNAEEIEEAVDQTLQHLTLEEKVGQMVQAELASVTPDDVEQYSLGSILNGGGVFPNQNKHASVDEWRTISEAFHEAASRSSSGVPLLWGTDAVHGHNNVVGATLFPHNIGLGAAYDTELIEQIGEATAADVSDTGIDWVFAPTLAVARDYRWGRTYESFSECAEIVAQCGAAYVRGLQGHEDSSGYISERRVIATSKHFIGEGATIEGIDQGDAICSERDLLDRHGLGHVALLQQGVATVMAAFNSWCGEKVHGSEYLLTKVLKEQMGFTGLVVSDWDGFQQLDADFDSAVAKAVNAGVDILMVSAEWLKVLNSVIHSVRNQVISEARIDDAVRRILRVKALRHLIFPHTLPCTIEPPRRETLYCEYANDLAREAVQKSLVLLKNNNHVLPIKPHQRVLVVGDAADSVAQQCGGWTLTWQGRDNTNHDFPHSESILAGIKNIVQGTEGEVTFVQSVPEDVEADVAIVVFGESPYAEGEGDLNHLGYSTFDDGPLRQMHLLKEAGIPVVAIFLTGRPLWITPELNVADSFVVAWLPGTQAGAMARVLFRSDSHSGQKDFVGKLPFSWPSRADQYCVNFDEPEEEPLFPLGYGLSYRDCGKQLPQYEEVSSSHEPMHRGPRYQGSYNYPK